jgi:acetyl-CoA carboxylase biotin carboxylase subunit
MVEEHGFTFIGPSPDHIRMMGDKIQAKRAAREVGLPCVPGSEGAVLGDEGALQLGREIGYPVLVKASGGGGGRGMQVARTEAELHRAIATARNEAKSAFGNDTVYLEKYLDRPRHIELQIVADGQGGVVHLGERDCSLQRRHQKVLEEAPSPSLNAAARERIGERVVDAIRKLGYRSLGTIEFLFQDGEFYFIEMNTRLQVEHPITEEVTGIDLVREQIRIASGAKLSFAQHDVRFEGHAIECRINAEHPETFRPSPGRITNYHAPGGPGVRIDSPLYAGYKVPPYYDSLIAKLIVHGRTRNECMMRLRRALDECVIDGIDTNIALHRRMLAAQGFIDGLYDIHWLEGLVGGKKG